MTKETKTAGRDTNQSRGSECPVSIVGYSLRAPNCSSVQEFAAALEGGKDLTTANTRYPIGHLGLPPRQGRLKDKDLANFNHSFFGLSHKQADVMDPSIRILLQVSYEAFMDAQINIESIRGSKTGVYIGHCFSDVMSRLTSCSNTDKTGYELVNGAHSMAANRLSYFYDLHGPSMTLDTACSSSLVALDRATRDIKAGIIDRAIVGGVSITLDPHMNATFNAFTMLSPTGHCHAFDSRANGYCRSEGVACVILERGEDGYACVHGSGTNSQGATPQGITYPSSKMQAELMKEVFHSSDVDPRSVSYHEAHGTGTVAGDREELSALSKLYSHPIHIGSVKSNMGHAEGASGLMSVIKVILMYEDQKLYPNFDFKESPHEMIGDHGNFSIVTKSQEWAPSACTISNFGFGGSNAFVVILPCPHRKGTMAIDEEHNDTPFVSNPGPVSLLSYADFYAFQRSIGNHSAFNFEWKNGSWTKSSPLIFVCDGQGSQWNTMGQDLMKNSEVFRDTIKRLEQETEIPLLSLYEDGTKWMLKENSILGIVSYQLGILAILANNGIKPDFFLGHSLGELTCAYLAGLQTEAEVLRLAQVRAELTMLIDKDSRLDVYATEPKDGYDYNITLSTSGKQYVKKVPNDTPAEASAIQTFSMNGKMVVIGCEANLVENGIHDLNLTQTCIACYNSPKGQTLSGPTLEVDQLVEQLTKKNSKLFVRELPTDGIAYHAPYLHVFREYLKDKFGNIDIRPLPYSWKSTSRSKIFGIEYLTSNICGSVYFQEAINSLPKGGTVVEIGPSSGLLTQIKRTRSDFNFVDLVKYNEPTNLDPALSRLRIWACSDQKAGAMTESQCRSSGKLHYQRRYPDIWGQSNVFSVPSWDDFELPKKASTAPIVSYDDIKDSKSRCVDNHTAITSVSGSNNSNNEEESYTIKQAQQFLANVLGGSATQYEVTRTLKSAGIDSLSTMEVVHEIQEKRGTMSFKPSNMADNFVVEDIVNAINTNRKVPVKQNWQQKESRQAENHTTEGTTSVKSTTTDYDKEISPLQQKKPFCEPLRQGGTVELMVTPYDIDFESMTRALDTADFLVLRQADAVVFNHGAPIDSDTASVAFYMDKYVKLAQAFSRSKAIVLVVIDGDVRGGGMLFPAMADICVATQQASFGLPEIHRDMVPSVVSRALVERLGQSTVRRLSLTGEAFDAANALQLGMIDSLVEKLDLEQYIENMLRRWKMKPAAARFIKNELLPRKESSMLAMGTVAGSWLTSREERGVLDGDRTVLDVSISDGIATLVMCDSVYQNTMTFEMTAAIRSFIPRLRAEARVVILTSSLKNFHVGLNPSRARQWASRPTCHVAADMKECYMGFVELAMLGIPIIGVLNGKVYGGGLPIALWCDYRIATTDVDVHYGNISRGMSPAGQLSRLLHEYLPAAEVMRTYLENSHWDSSDLLRLGIVAHVARGKNEALHEARRLAAYIVNQPMDAVRDTLRLIKTTYAPDVADEEAWLIAEKITQGAEPFKQKDHGSFEVAENPALCFQKQAPLSSVSMSGLNTAVGIVALEVYTPDFAILSDTLEQNNISARKKNGQEAVAVWDRQEDAISMAMNAVSRLLEKHVIDPCEVGRIEVGTESNIDMAKSIKSYLMDLMPKDHMDVEGVDNINACYGGTSALLNTIAWCRETRRYGIVVATDTADMDLQDSAWRGASAVAMLVGPEPWIEIHPERSSCFKNTHDFLKPRYSTQITPFIQTKASMTHYLNALDNTIDNLWTKHGIDAGTFDTIVFHGGLCVTFMKLVESHLVKKVRSSSNWDVKFDMARDCASLMGGLYTASLYVNLVSLLHACDPKHQMGRSKENVNHIGLFSYGSGSTATLLHATIHHERAHNINLHFQLNNRENVSFDILSSIVKSKANSSSSEVLPRRTGIYYFNLSKNTTKREYFKQKSVNFALTQPRIKLGKSIQVRSEGLTTQCQMDESDNTDFETPTNKRKEKKRKEGNHHQDVTLHLLLVKFVGALMG